MLGEGRYSLTVQRGIDGALVMQEMPASASPAPSITMRHTHAFLPESGFRRAAPGRPLSRREREILALLCLRLTDLEIAERLYVSRRTVTTHVSNILAKLDVTNRREAAAMAGHMLLI